MTGSGLGGMAIGIERRRRQGSPGMADERVGQRQPGIGVTGILANRAEKDARGVGVLAVAGKCIGNDNPVAVQRYIFSAGALGAPGRPALP